MSKHHYVAADLGADSGRVILGTLADGKLEIEDIHRFSTGIFNVGGSWRWNITRLYEEIRTGLFKIKERGIVPDSFSADSWGVDYAWLKKGEPLLSLPFHYRHPRNDVSFPAFCEVVSKDEIFDETGLQFMPFNTLFQFYADKTERPWIFDAADGFLNIADYLNHTFGGDPVSEESLASTTQLYNPKEHAWSEKLIGALGMRRDLFPKVVPSGTVTGSLDADLASELGFEQTKIVASCSHDTGAAVAAVPGGLDGSQGWAYLSSGTWSLLGVELPEAQINDEVKAENYTNEIGLGGSIRFLKNIIGLWLVQESRRYWLAQGQEFGYAALSRLATEAEPFRSLINPNSPEFLKPGDMPLKIADFCRRTGQPVPETPGQVVRCADESLALFYREKLEGLEKLTGRAIKSLHIVGGGSKDNLLNQMTANATGRQVFAGPDEATAIGNLLVQGLALGHVKDHAELRRIVRDSFELKEFAPQDQDAWAANAQRFSEVCVKGKEAVV